MRHRRVGLRSRGTARLSGSVAVFDRTVDSFFDRHLRGRRAVDRLFYAASALGDHGLIWLILATARGLRRGENLPAAVRAGAGIAVESALINGPFKLVFRRARPEVEGIRPLHLRTPRTSSFPSGHATSAFCAAGLLSEDDALWPLYYTVALVVAWSRVHVKIHHASDVVGGIVIGAALGHAGRQISPLHGPSPLRGRGMDVRRRELQSS